MTRSVSSQLMEILTNLIVALVVIDGLLVIISGMIVAGAFALVANRVFSVLRFVRVTGLRSSNA